jgi:hypothetical protein
MRKNTFASPTGVISTLKSGPTLPIEEIAAKSRANCYDKRLLVMDPYILPQFEGQSSSPANVEISNES